MNENGTINLEAELDGLIEEVTEKERIIKDLTNDLAEYRRRLHLAGIRDPQKDADLAGEVFSFLGHVEEPKPQQFVVERLIPERKLTLFAAPGGSLKTILSIFLAFCLTLDRKFLGLSVRQSDVLFVDYELERDDFIRRAISVSNGMGLGGQIPLGIHYWRPKRPLSDPELIEDLRSLQQQYAFGTVIIDSISMGSMGKDMSESVPVIEILQNLGRIGFTIFGLDHVSHQGRTAGSKSVPFGSVFKMNCARSVITASSENGVYTLHHIKANFSKLHDDISYEAEFLRDDTLPLRGSCNVIKIGICGKTIAPIDKFKEYREAVESIIQDTGRHPTKREIAEHMRLDHVNERTVERWLAEASHDLEEAASDNGSWKGLYRWKEGKGYRYTTSRFISENLKLPFNNDDDTIGNVGVVVVDSEQNAVSGTGAASFVPGPDDELQRSDDDDTDNSFIVSSSLSDEHPEAPF